MVSTKPKKMVIKLILRQSNKNFSFVCIFKEVTETKRESLRLAFVDDVYHD